MKKKNAIQQYLQTIPHIVRYVLLGALVLFISLFFPNNIRLDYNFEPGESWRYEDLRAPFAFPIKKSETLLAQEKEYLAKDFMPYYRLNAALGQEQIASFETAFAQRYLQLNDSVQALIDSSQAQDLGQGLLAKTYEQHIIELASQHQAEGKELQFRLIEQQVELGEHQALDFLSQREAAQIVVDSLGQLPQSSEQTELLLALLDSLMAQADINYDASLTAKNKALAIDNVSLTRGMVKAGELIIRRNELVDSTAYAKLISYKEKYDQEINQHKNGFLIYLGYLLLTLALIAIFSIFMRTYSPELFNNNQHLSLILVFIAGYSYLSFAVDQLPELSSYLIPFCIVPIVIKNFFSAQMALFTHIVIILIASMLLSLDYQFILVQIIVGMVAVLTKRKTRYLTDFFFAVLYIGIAYAACYLGLELIHKGAFSPVLAEDGRLIEEGVEWGNLGWISFNVFLTLLTYPLIPLLERIFGLISEITLVELSDLNKPLLKELSLKAPGTMQHSLQVANLAEAACSEVGGNALLVKVGALYHDIGKMLNPPYFIENQNQYNPHEELTYKESAAMIIGHVTEGVKLAKKYRLPRALVDFIATHHGSTRVEYFYRMYQKENPDLEVDPADFTYPGPAPRNKEEAILMLADSIEAASKSLKNPTGQDIDQLVDKIVKFKLELGQLQNTNITFKELDQIKAVFKKMLRSIQHVRIEYPEEQKKKSE